MPEPTATIAHTDYFSLVTVIAESIHLLLEKILMEPLFMF